MLVLNFRTLQIVEFLGLEERDGCFTIKKVLVLVSSVTRASDPLACTMFTDKPQSLVVVCIHYKINKVVITKLENFFFGTLNAVERDTNRQS